MTEPTKYAGLVERLEEPNGKGVNTLGYHPLINPDGPEAADAIRDLEAEVDLLWLALEARWHHWYLQHEKMRSEQAAINARARIAETRAHLERKGT